MTTLQRINYSFFKNRLHILTVSFLMPIIFYFCVIFIFKSPLLVAFGMFLVFIGLFALGKPYALFLSYILFIPFLQIYRFFTESPIFLINILKDIVFLLIVFVFLLNLLLKAHDPLMNSSRDNRFNLIMSVYIIYMLMQIFRTPSLIVGVLGFREVVEFMFAFFLAQFFLRTESRVKKAIQFIFISGFVVALIGIIQKSTGVNYDHNAIHLNGIKIYRLSSTLGNPNTLGFFMVITILISIILLFNKSKIGIKRFFILFSIVLIASCLFLSYSRTAFIGLAVGILVISLMKSNIRPTISLVIIITLTLFFMPSELGSRLTGIAHGLDPGRLDMWASTWEQFKQHPVIGVGYGKVGGLDKTGAGGGLRRILSESTDQMVVIDNSYLLLLTETGIIGFSIFCSLLIFIFKRGWLSMKKLKSQYLRRLSICLFSILVALSIAAITANIFGMLFPINFYFWLLSGILVNLKSIDSDITKKEKGF